MPNLYTQLAVVYDEIYQTLFDYDAEFAIYADFLTKYKAKSVVEIGCGTGHLAKRFVAGGYDYLGLDNCKKRISAFWKLPPSVCWAAISSIS